VTNSYVILFLALAKTGDSGISQTTVWRHIHERPA